MNSHTTISEEENPKGCMTCMGWFSENIDCDQCLEIDLQEGGPFQHPNYVFNPNWFEDSNGEKEVSKV